MPADSAKVYDAFAKSSARKGVFSFLVLLLFVSVLVLNIRPIAAYDFWHHLKAGELVFQNRAVARVEPFLIPAKDMPWIQFEWLAQLFFYVIYTKLGVNALIIIKASTFAVSFAVLALACRQRSKSFAIPILVSALAAFSLSTRSFERPEFISYFLFALTIYILEKARHNNAGWLIALPFIIAIWANVHGLYIVAIALLGITAFGETARFISGKGNIILDENKKFKRRIIWLWLFFLLSFCGALVNPYGAKIFEVPFKLFASPAISQLIVEWRPFTLTDFLHLEQIGFWILLLAAIITIRKINLTDFLILAVFFYLAMKSARNVMLFLFVCAPIFAAHLDYLKEKLGKIEMIPEAIKRPMVGWILLIFFLAFMVWYGQGIPDFWRFGLGINESIVPRKGADFLEKNEIKGNIFNTLEFGNFLLWRLYPQNQVFVDGRVDVYGEKILNLAAAIRYARKGWQEELKKYGITIVLLDTKSGGDKEKRWGILGKGLFKETSWALVYFDDVCLIFLKRDEDNNKIIARLGEYSFCPLDFDASLIADEKEMVKIMSRLGRTLEEDNENLFAHRASGACYLRLKKYDDAIEHFLFVFGRKPHSGMDAYNLGLAYMLKGDLQNAENLLSRSLIYGVPPVEVYRNLGIIYLEEKRFEKALRVMKIALKSSADDWQLHWNCAAAYEAIGDIPSAIDEIKTVRMLNPSFTQAKERLEELLHPQKKVVPDIKQSDDNGIN